MILRDWSLSRIQVEVEVEVEFEIQDKVDICEVQLHVKVCILF